MDYENLEKRVERLEMRQETYNNDMSEVLQKITKIETILESKDEISNLKTKNESTKAEEIEKRVGKLESSQTWLIRAITVEVIGLLSLIVTTLVQKGI